MVVWHPDLRCVTQCVSIFIPFTNTHHNAHNTHACTFTSHHIHHTTEIWTDAELPYKGMSNQKVWVEVLAGYRLSQPAGCPDDVYKLMTECWDMNPHNRPVFSSMGRTLQIARVNKISVPVVEALPAPPPRSHTPIIITDEVSGYVQAALPTPPPRSVSPVSTYEVPVSGRDTPNLSTGGYIQVSDFGPMPNAPRNMPPSVIVPTAVNYNIASKTAPDPTYSEAMQEAAPHQFEERPIDPSQHYLYAMATSTNPTDQTESVPAVEHDYANTLEVKQSS